MPEQLREALENAGVERTENRREAMERAFDTLSGEGTEGGTPHPEGHSEGYGKPDAKGGEEPVVKWSDNSKSPIKREGEPLKPLAKKPAAAEKPVEKPRVGGPPQKGKDAGQREQPPAAKTKAPVSWKPEEREHWESLSPQAQAAVMRRETEITKALNDSAAARRFGGEFYNVIRPYEHLIRASGVGPLQAVDNLVKTAAGLQTGTAVQKASIVANICAAYGVDLRVLDSVLAGKSPPAGAGQNDELMKAIDERLKPVQEFIGEVRGARTAADGQLQAETAQEAEAFASDPKNEFFEDLRGDVADILDLAANRGRQMTLQQAYDLACQQHPEIAKVIKDRADAAATAERAKSFDRSRRASVSQPTGNPAGIGRSSKQTGESRRDSIGRAWDDLSAG